MFDKVMDWIVKGFKLLKLISADIYLLKVIWNHSGSFIVNFELLHTLL